MKKTENPATQRFSIDRRGAARNTRGRVCSPFLVTCLRLCLLLFSGSVWAGDRDVVINEIMYHPPNDREDLQYVELFNRGESAVDVSRWSFSKGIKFEFPANTKIDAGSYLVVCRNLSQFAAAYGKDAAVLGNFSGKLSHQGDRLDLSDAQKKVIDSVKYSDREGWPTGPDGYSASLERICPTADSQMPENWAASKLPAAKTPSGTPGGKNDNFSAKLPPVISAVEISPKAPSLGQAVTVRTSVTDVEGVKAVTLLSSVVTPGKESAETQIPMTRKSGDGRKGIYEATLDGQPAARLVRYRIKAEGSNGIKRTEPSENEPRRTYSYYTLAGPNTARVPFGFVVNATRMERAAPQWYGNPRPGRSAGTPARGTSGFVYVPPDGAEVQVFDHVRVVPRKGGYKVHFQKDRPLHGMTSINIISEGPPRWVLSEPLAYELYRLAGVPAPQTGHLRFWLDGRPLGYQLLVEQPNKAFLARHQRNDSGNLYKLLWYGQGVVGQHEKKTNLPGGHQDLVQLIDGLNRRQGQEQWQFIQENFNVEEVINYFAVNMCIQNWDGFFNNYFTYHDLGGTGKWEIYPWDEDKTWGDYDGASPRYDWYEMPLTFGMNGDQAAGGLRSFFNRGPFGGGASWWRPPGYFSGPLLANPEFRKKFLARLREICLTVFTEQKFFPVTAEMEKRLEPEVRFKAESHGQDPQHSLRQFQGDIESFRGQVQNRRKFILKELGP